MKKWSAAALIILIIIFALPILVMVLSSFADEDLIDALKNGSVEGIQFGTEQYRKMFTEGDLIQKMGNSAVIALGALAVQIPVGLAGGLFLARSEWKAKKVLTGMLMIALLLPFQSMMVPMFRMSKWSGLYDTHAALILLCGFSPLAFLFMMVLIGMIPNEQWEAASLDTKSLGRIVFAVVLPQILPGMAVLVLLIFSEAWNMVEQPLILLQDDVLRPAALVLNDIKKDHSGYEYAGSVLYSLPVVVLYAAALAAMRKQSGIRPRIR